MCDSCGCGCKPGKPDRGCDCQCKTCREARMSKYQVEKSLRELQAFADEVNKGLTDEGLKAFYHDAGAMKARVEKERVETQELWSKS